MHIFIAIFAIPLLLVGHACGFVACLLYQSAIRGWQDAIAHLEAIIKERP